MNKHKGIIPVEVPSVLATNTKNTDTETGEVDNTTVTSSAIIKSFYEASCNSCHCASSSNWAANNYTGTKIYAESCNCSLNDKAQNVQTVLIKTVSRRFQLWQVE
ncbi:MAG: hypothetical protein ACI8ZM_000076 [Crocinitomix sp.]|jgi:hypothetical protein